MIRWYRRWRREKVRRTRLAAKILDRLLTATGGPKGWSEEDCAQVADLRARQILGARRKKAYRRWTEATMRRILKEEGRQ